jgi:GNAT superfamily N-acetyltransferase
MYSKATNALKKVKINNLFARSVIEQHVSGKVYADNADNPTSFYVIHPYGMSLLFGDHHNKDFNQWFLEYSLNTGQIRNGVEWMQAYPREWDKELKKLYGDRLVNSGNCITDEMKGTIVLNTRINFKFNRSKYQSLKKRVVPDEMKLVSVDGNLFHRMVGSVVPSKFWDNADDFLRMGKGFSLLDNDLPVATAYSAFVHDNQLELGIETLENYRGQGLAFYVCAALIDYCLEKGIEPVWACRLENTGSYKLAQKLGFDPVMEIPYYKLSR